MLTTNLLNNSKLYSNFKLCSKCSHILIPIHILMQDIDPSRRLGAGPDGYLALKLHPFFKGIDWHNLRQGSVRKLAMEFIVLNSDKFVELKLEFILANSDISFVCLCRQTRIMSLIILHKMEVINSQVLIEVVVPHLPLKHILIFLLFLQLIHLTLNGMSSPFLDFFFSWSLLAFIINCGEIHVVACDDRRDFLEPGESILMTSKLKKFRKLKSKKVQLILTDKPRLISVNANKLMEKKIVWSDNPNSINVQVVNSSHFKITTVSSVLNIFYVKKTRSIYFADRISFLANKGYVIWGRKAASMAVEKDGRRSSKALKSLPKFDMINASGIKILHASKDSSCTRKPIFLLLSWYRQNSLKFCNAAKMTIHNWWRFSAIVSELKYWEMEITSGLLHINSSKYDIQNESIFEFSGGFM